MFTVKTAYELLVQGEQWLDPFWKILWKLKIPPKLQFFLWLFYHEKIMSNAQRVKRRLSSDSSCSYCGWYNEDALHILRDCSKAKELWSQFLLPSQFSKFF